MKIYHTETQEDYNTLMVELEEKGRKWLGGNEPTFFKFWKTYKESTCIIISDKGITFGNIEQSKKQHPNIPIIEYKAKGENMKMTKEEMKRYFLNESRDISIAIENFVVDDSTTENHLSKAKSSAKKLIEKIDEYLESLKPKFKVGDYVTDTSDDNHFICKIEKLEGNDISGIWYCVSNKYFDKLFRLPISDSRLSTPEEIAEYKVALNFHKHGRKPFEVKEGDLIESKSGRNIIVFYPENYSRGSFLKDGWKLLKTAEEFNEWVKGENE